MGHGHAHHHANHGHNHDGHGHDGRSHGGGEHNNQGRLALAAIMTGLFMVAEVTGGLISGSLALLADAGHMLTDFGALALAWAGFAIAKRPQSARHHFGFERFQILTAFVNGLTLMAISIWIFIEAAERLFAPGEVLAGPMLIVAIIGLIVNLFVFWLLLGADRENLNIRGAVLHVLGDLLGSLAAIAAALIIMKTGWVQADPILSFLVVMLILRSAWFLVKESAHILLQGAPAGFDAEALSTELKGNMPQVTEVSKIRAWALTPANPVLTLQVSIMRGADWGEIQKQIRGYIREQYKIDDVTIELSEPPSSNGSS